MDFVTGFPRTSQGLDVVWAVVDRLTKSAHFIPIRIDYIMDKLVQIYTWVPESIISDRGPQFQSRFWKGLSEAMGTKLL